MMLKLFVNKVINMIDQHYPISDQQKDVCSYGLDILLYTVISTIGLFLIGCFFHMPIEATIVSSAFT